MRRNRPAWSQLSDEERRRGNARAYLNVYVRRGKVVREPCIRCGATPTEGHHYLGYDRPLDVVWLCRPHHREQHKGLASVTGA